MAGGAVVSVKPGDNISPREGPGAGIYPEGGAGLGLGVGAPRVQLSNSGQDPLGSSGDEADVP